MGANSKLRTGPKRRGTIKTIHIDTSLQIERCKEPKKAKIVEQALKAFGFISTSTYAKFEFKHAWLRDLAYLHSCCQSQEVNRLEELVGRINDKLNAHPANRNRVSRCLEAIESFLSRVPGDISYEAAFLRLQNHIRNALLGAYPWWDSLSIHYEYDGTSCTRAREQPRPLRGGQIDVSIPWCRPDEIRCAIHQFFEKNRQYFTTIKIAIEQRGHNISKELQEAKKVIEDAEQYPQYLCDDRICRKLGDILIAIDGLDMDYFGANNDKEWEFLSNFFDKELINPVREAKTTNKT